MSSEPCFDFKCVTQRDQTYNNSRILSFSVKSTMIGVNNNYPCNLKPFSILDILTKYLLLVHCDRLKPHCIGVLR